MRFKRDEGFGFSFGTPIPAFFTIDEMNGNRMGGPEGEARLIDLSPNGMKLNIQLDIPTFYQDDVKISVRFKLSQTEHKVQGKIIWKQKAFDSYFYGIHFNINEVEQNDMIKDIKYFAKKQNTK